MKEIKVHGTITESWSIDGCIKLDSTIAKELGFTSDRFSGWLWKKNQYIIISFIESLHQGEGNLSKLFNKIISKGYGIKVPTPFPKMKAILINKGFKRTESPFQPPHIMDLCEIWIREPVEQSVADAQKARK